MATRLILASNSPRRYELLKRLGLDFEVIPSRVDEGEMVQGESPRGHVLRLSEAKAMEVGYRNPDRWVIGADTIVYADGALLGKPESREEAIRMLALLSGKEHQVLTGFSVRHVEKGKGDREVVQTWVRVKPLAEAEMRWYVQTGEPFDKAGAYGIQGIGSFMIESIHGSYANVVGLPVCELLQMLRRLGALTILESGIRIEE